MWQLFLVIFEYLVNINILPISPLKIDPSHLSAKTGQPVLPCKANNKRLTVLKELEYSSHKE